MAAILAIVSGHNLAADYCLISVKFCRGSRIERR